MVGIAGLISRNSLARVMGAGLVRVLEGPLPASLECLWVAFPGIGPT